MDDLLDVIVRHQVYLEGLKNGRELEFTKKIVTLDLELRKQLAFVTFDNLSDMTRTALNKLVIELRKVANKVFDVWLKELVRWLEEYISVDSEFWQFAYGLAKPDQAEQIQEETPDNETIFGIASNFPMGANGVLMLSFARGFATLAGQKIAQTTMLSYANAEKPVDLVRRISGTKSNNYRDGLIAQLNRQGIAVSNTIIQHVAAQTNAAVAAKVWAKYFWVSILDDATTRICRDRDGNVYRFGEGPVPPAHVGCRSSILPFDGAAPDAPRFKLWASRQSREFLNDAFDGKATSRYEGSKAISLAQFRAKRPLIVG